MEGLKIKENPFLSFLKTFKLSFKARLMEVSAFTVFAVAGLLVAALTSGVSFHSLIFSSIVLLPAWIFLAVAVYSFNDLFDREIDEKNERDLPLSSGEAKESEIRNMIIVSTIISLLITLFLDLRVFSACLAYLGIGIIYSAPPLELKRRLFGKPFSVSIGLVLSYLAGVVSLSGLSTMHLYLILVIGVHFFLNSSVTDLRDVEGDKLEDRSNLPLVIGRKHTAEVIMSSFVIMPVFALIGYVYFGFNLLFVGLIGGLAVLNILKLAEYRRHYKEGRICKEAIIRVFMAVYSYPVVFAVSLL